MAALDADIEKRLAEVIPVSSSQYCSPRPHTAPAVEVLREALEELKLENKGTVKIGNVVSEVGGNAGRGGTAREEVQDEDGKASDEKKTREELPKRGKDQYPQRSGEPDCGYFIKTGKCAFGKNCKFNHPSEGRKIQVQNPHSQDTSQILEESVREFEVKKIEEELPVKVGKLKCKYFGTPGGCKYGDACRYGHFLDKSEEKVELNFLGLPVRPAEKECQFYMRTGSCKFSANCRYHHPNPTVTGGNDPASWHHQITKDGSVLFADSSHSYMPQMPMMTQLHANHVWDICQAPNDPFLDGMPMHHPFGPRAAVAANGSENQPPVTPSSMITDSSNGSNSRQSVQIADLPQRPGQPECPYYLRKGGCKYKSCKFHHPKDLLTDQSSCVLTPSGLPLRPGQSICIHYSRYGICKLGPACSFDHPTNGIPS